MTLDQLGVVAMCAVLLFALGVVQKSQMSTEMKAIISVALLLRLAGAGARMYVLFGLYGGTGDAVAYFDRSLEYSLQLRGFEFDWLFDPEMRYRSGSPWWGTQFVHVPTTFVLAVLGPSMLAGFVAFSLLAFVGLMGMLSAFKRAMPEARPETYALWLLLFPSLWFWPSSIGKEALVVFGMGVSVAGFIGRGKDPNWLLLALGLSAVFAIRPQLAAVLIISMGAAQWLGRGTGFTMGTLLRGIPILLVGLWVVYRASNAVGLEELSVGSIDSFISDSPTRRAEGATNVDLVPVGVFGIPLALLNILFRPLPWEARNPMVLMSALEIWTLWGIAFFRRRTLMETLRKWRSNRLVTLSLAFVLIYSVALGLMVVNVGIIARQRIFLFPFLFVLLWSGSRRPRVPRKELWPKEPVRVGRLEPGMATAGRDRDVLARAPSH